jgi:hypothetical protein
MVHNTEGRIQGLSGDVANGLTFPNCGVLSFDRWTFDCNTEQLGANVRRGPYREATDLHIYSAGVWCSRCFFRFRFFSSTCIFTRLVYGTRVFRDKSLAFPWCSQCNPQPLLLGFSMCMG